MITTDALKNILLLKPGNHDLYTEWESPLTGKVGSPYSDDIARSLLEFAYLVMIHNREVSDKLPNPIELKPPNFDVVIPIDILNMCNVAWVFYSTSMNIMVISFTGTYNYSLIAADVDYYQRDPTSIHNYVKGMRIHGGFWTLYQLIQSTLLNTVTKYINIDTQVLITGMSLGGATSTICTLDLHGRTLANGVTLTNLVHYSFASPRLFNITGSRHYDQFKISSYRIENGCDIIPDVPFPIMLVSLNPFTIQDFVHVDVLEYFKLNLGTYYDNHILAYLKHYNLHSVAK